MYTLDGVALDNPTLGWTLQWASVPDIAVTMERPEVVIPGLDGVPQMPGRMDAPPLTFVVRTGQAGRDALAALARRAKLAAKVASGLVVPVELLTMSPDRLRTATPTWDVTIVFRAGTAWRDPSDTTSAAVSLASASQLATVMSGLSAPVRDAIIRVKGAVTGLLVTDSSGSWVSYGSSLPSGSYWRFDSATGRAYVTTSDTWTGGTEVTGATDWSDIGAAFTIAPSFTDPATRAGVLTVATSTRSGATVEVRGRRAYAFD